MIRGIHYFNAEFKTQIDVIPRGCFNQDYTKSYKNISKTNLVCSDIYIE